jgi:hypothetical protein
LQKQKSQYIISNGGFLSRLSQNAKKLTCT